MKIIITEHETHIEGRVSEILSAVTSILNDMYESHKIEKDDIELVAKLATSSQEEVTRMAQEKIEKELEKFGESKDLKELFNKLKKIVNGEEDK